MGTTLTGTTPQDTYDSLIKVTDNGPISGTLKALSDGLGNDSTLSLSTTAASIAGTLAVAGAATFDTTTLVVDATNNRVGINKATPTTTLDVSGTFAVSGNATFDTSTLVVDAANNRVGIGTASPTAGYSLSVVGAFAAGVGGAYVEVGEFDRSLMILNHTNASVNANLFEVQKSGTGVLTVNSAGILQVSSGIQFPATQVASANANTLDDYEEGTWTATLTDGTVTKTATCSYTKIGRVVYIAGGISNAEDPSSFTGSVYVTGVPFTPAFSVSLYGFNNYLPTASIFVPYLESNQVIRFYKVGATSADNVQMQGSDLDFYSDIYFSGQFTV